MEAKPKKRRTTRLGELSSLPSDGEEAFLLLIHQPGGLPPGRGEWPSGQKRQTVNLLKVFYVGSNPASPTSDSREEKGRIRQRRKANRAKLFLFCGRAVKCNFIVCGVERFSNSPDLWIPHPSPIPTSTEASRFWPRLGGSRTHARAIMPQAYWKGWECFER